MSSKVIEKFFLGVDVSKKTVDCVLYSEKIDKMKYENHFKTTNDEKGCEEILMWLKKRKATQKSTLICMEYTGRYSFIFANNLAALGLKFCLIPAIKIKGAFAGARGKNDKVDAIRIAQYAYRYKDELKPTELKNDKILKLRDLMNDRKMVVIDIASRKNILKEHKNTPEDSRYQRAKEGIEFLSKQLQEIEDDIIAIIKSDDALAQNYTLLTSISGISLVNAVNLIVFTNNFKSFKNAREFAAYCGIAPFEYTSGTSVNKGTHVSKMGNKQVKADLSMAAQAAIWCDAEIKQYYKRKRQEGKSFGCVLNAVKFKLISRAFAVIKRGTPYVNTRKFAA